MSDPEEFAERKGIELKRLKFWIRVLAAGPRLEDRDEGQGRERQTRVDPAKNRREGIERDDLPEAETAALEHLAVEPPGGQPARLNRMVCCTSNPAFSASSRRDSSV